MFNSFLMCFITVFMVTFSSAQLLASTHSLSRHTNMLDLSMPDEKRQVWRGGDWQYNGMSGYIQVIYMPHPYSAKGEAPAQSMQLQWVRTDHSKEESVYMVSVNELNHSANFQFATPRCLSSANCNTLSVLVRSHYEDHVTPFKLTIGGLGQYELTPSTTIKSKAIAFQDNL